MNAFAVSYSYWLVAVSILTCIVASYASFNFAERIASAKGFLSLYWLSFGAIAMGLGIWSMHYLGMLAVHLPVPVFFHVPTVASSLLLAIAASAVALWLVSQERLGKRAFAIGSVAMGGAIGGMHYNGMSAMRSAAMHHYNHWIVALSIVVAVVFSWMALNITFSLRKQDGAHLWRRIGGAVLMGTGISAMHYTAMIGVTFVPSNMPYSTHFTVRIAEIDQFAIILMTSMVLVGALISSYGDRKTNRQLRAANERLEEMQAILIERERELSEAIAKLKELSQQDDLTGIHNRRYFDEALASECKRAIRANYPISLLLVDVDHFKRLNDLYGHLVGDECLRRVAERMSKTLRRTSDLVARYGGEEFGVILPNSDEKSATTVAEMLRSAVEDLKIPNEGSSVSDYLTLSVGACTRNGADITTPEEMIHAADKALYRAKCQGRNRVLTAA
jgi:diguanylate cyclase (GGDEF)-like protein